MVPAGGRLTILITVEFSFSGPTFVWGKLDVKPEPPAGILVGTVAGPGNVGPAFNVSGILIALPGLC